MATHDNPATRTYTLPLHDSTAGDSTWRFKGPPGHFGRLVEVAVAITVQGAGATTTPVIKVGISGTLGKFFSKDLGTSAVGGYVFGPLDAANAGNAVVPNLLLQPDTEFYITQVAATGGGAAGKHLDAITIDWFTC